MLTAVVLALAVAAGAHPVAVMIVGLAVVQPAAFPGAAGAWSLYHAHRRAQRQRAMPSWEADYLRAVSAEIESGASVRRALATAAGQAPELDLAATVRRAEAGRPVREVAVALQRALPLNGRMAAAAYQLVSETGARASGVFAGLAVRAAVAGDVERERRVLTAQVRLTAWIIGGVPVVATVALIVLGRSPSGGGTGRLVTVIGLALVSTGKSLVNMPN